MNDFQIDNRFLNIGVEGVPDGYLPSCLPRKDVCGDHFPVYEDEFYIHPRDTWDKLIEDAEPLELLIAKVKDQKQEGSCCPNATCGVFEVCWNMAFGLEQWVEFSPISLYRWLSPGPSSGVYIPDAMKQLMDVGVLPCDTPRNRQFLEEAGLNPNHVLSPTGYNQPFPTGWQETALHFRAAEVVDFRTFDGIVSASLDKFGVVYGRAGHAIYCVRVVKRGGTYYLRYMNSWGQWGEVALNGLRGIGHDSESYVKPAVKGYGAFGVRTPVITEQIAHAVAYFKE